MPAGPPPGEGGRCDGGDPSRERTGTNCFCCHSQFGVAGSAVGAVDRVIVVGADGKGVDMAVNPYGNFFRHRKLEPPLRARVVLVDGQVREMRGDAPHGSCNACHVEGGLAAILGR